MPTKRLLAAAAAALVIPITLACDLPTWDADFLVPLPSQRIRLDSAFGFVPAIPAGTTTDISFPEKTAALDESLGDIIEEMLVARLIATVTTTVPLDGVDTVFVAGSSADLVNPAAVRVTLVMTMVAAVATTVDTIDITTAELDMLKNVALAGDSLHIQMRGRVTYPGPGPRPVGPTDSIGVRLQLLARVPVVQ